MDRLSLHLWTCDAGAAAAGPEDYAALITGRVRESWDAGADLVIFPEFCWLGLERFMTGPDRPAAVARWFWHHLWPDLTTGLARPGKAAVLGTVPWRGDCSRLRNRAPVILGDRVAYQDKLHLTPWEAAFEGGDRLLVWEFCGARVAVLVCLDVEIPELAAALRCAQPDLIIVPSATDNLLGVERINRCADARAVELGCMVAVCPLVGRADSSLVDENLGRLALYAPSQAAFAESERQLAGGLLTGGFHRLAAEIDLTAIRRCRSLTDETSPCRLQPVVPRVQFVETAQPEDTLAFSRKTAER